MGDVVVLCSQQEVGALDHGDLGAEGIEDVGHLVGDVPTTEHGESRWKFREAHDRVGGVVTDFGQTRYHRHDRAGSRGDDDVGSGDLVTVDGERLVAGELGFGLDQGDVGQVAAVLLAAFGDQVDSAEDPLDDVGPADGVDAQIDAELRRVAGAEHTIGGENEHLRRNAAPVEAGSPEHAAFDDGDLPRVELGEEHHVAGARPDDDEIVSFHCRRLPIGWQSPEVSYGWLR